VTTSASTAIRALADAFAGVAPAAPGLERAAAGGLTAADVEELRRALLAGSGEGSGPITRDEADALLALVDATAGRDNHPSFSDLFARALGNHLLALGEPVGPEVRESLRRDRWLDERHPITGGVRGFFARSLTCIISGDGFVNAAGSWLARGAADAVFEAKLGQAGQMIDRAEAAWLRRRLAGCESGASAVRALLDFVHDEAAMPAMTETLLDKVA
jgi:hypothetical protein